MAALDSILIASRSFLPTPIPLWRIIAMANMASELPKSDARAYASYASDSFPSSRSLSASARARSLASSSRWASVLDSLSTRASNVSLGAPPRTPMTAFHDTMHFSCPMSTPYLYHLAASMSSRAILLRPYSYDMPMRRNRSPSPVMAADENHISASVSERSTPIPREYM